MKILLRQRLPMTNTSWVGLIRLRHFFPVVVVAKLVSRAPAVGLVPKMCPCLLSKTDALNFALFVRFFILDDTVYAACVCVSSERCLGYLNSESSIYRQA